jgi:fibronectin type 3 domain-containing protein
LGYGWREAVGMLATQRPGKDALTDDFVESGIYRVFQADVPNGAYRVQLRMGDPKAPVKTCNIIIEGKLRAANLGMKTGETITKTFDVRVDDGRLDIGFSSFGQWAARWCINAIEIAPTEKGAADRTEAIKVESKPNDTPVLADKTDCGCGL